MLLETFLLSIFVFVALDSDAMRYGGRIPSTGILGRLAYATVALILNLPAVVITYRLVLSFIFWNEFSEHEYPAP
jgi:hypothetical protein